MRSSSSPAPASLFYRSIRRLFLVLAFPMFRFRVEGAGRVPVDGPCVVVAPHRSWLDPACVGAACPRPVRFLIMARVYDRPWLRWFYRSLGSIPVRPGAGGATAALRSALRHLRGGGVIGVFPEGRVVPAGEWGTIRAGAALLAVRSGAPVVPLDIRGSARAWPHGRAWPGPAAVRVRIGAPIHPPGDGPGDPVADMQRRIEAGLRQLSLSQDEVGP